MPTIALEDLQKRVTDALQVARLLGTDSTNISNQDLWALGIVLNRYLAGPYIVVPDESYYTFSDKS